MANLFDGYTLELTKDELSSLLELIKDYERLAQEEYSMIYDNNKSKGASNRLQDIIAGIDFAHLLQEAIKKLQDSPDV